MHAYGGTPGIPPGDPLYQPPPNVTPTYIVGGAIALSGAAWLVYSYAALPSGPPPATQRAQRRFTLTELVEATGCGLVPGDAVVAGEGKEGASGGKQDRDVAARLQELEKLDNAGLLTDEEYRRKHKEVVDGL